VPCPSCDGNLYNDRSNFSKNQTLFPVFGLDGAPLWCIVQSMLCRKCKRRFDANSSAVLLKLPAYVALTYPVATKYAFPNRNCHLNENATKVFDHLMLTYTNGEVYSKLLFNSINRAFIKKLKIYYSAGGRKGRPYLAKDGEFIKQYPPLGDTVRSMHDEASNSSDTPWKISDKDRNTRELQSVTCHDIFAQDHTFSMVKNYQKRLGAKALWDVGTATGEIAAAVLVQSTRTEDFAHAAQMLVNRPWFNTSTQR